MSFRSIREATIRDDLTALSDYGNDEEIELGESSQGESGSMSFTLPVYHAYVRPLQSTHPFK